MNKQAKIITFSSLYMLGIIAFFSNHTLAAAFIILTVAAVLCLYNKLFSVKQFCIFAFVLTFGIFNSVFHLKYDDELTSFADENVTVTAKVCSIPTNNLKDRTKFYAQITSVKTENMTKENINVKSLISINDSAENLKNIKIGDTLSVNGRLKVPRYAQNPSQFDYSRYLQLKNTFSLIYANKDWEIACTKSGPAGSFLRKLNDTRNKIISIHAQNIKSPMLEILGGIIFGDDAVNPDDDTKNSFINSGIFHILAASGMNVTLIFGIWFFFAKNLRFNYKFSIITGILLILFYTCMTGFGPPIIRAALMLTLILIGKLIDRETATISLLFIVAFLMLALNPLMLFDIGFQLSFIVTFALILTAPLLVFKFKYKAVNYIIGACMVPVTAQIYAAPLQMYYFNTFAVYSVFANIAIIPVLSIVSFMGFISSIIALIPAFAPKVCFIADFILNPFLIYIVKTAEFFSGLPSSIIFLKKPMIIQILIYFAIVISLTCALRVKTKSKKVYISIVSMLLILLLTFIPISQKKPEIIFFSVGNADSILIKSPENDYFMIDTARAGYKNSNSPAKNIMIKYMKDKGIKTLKGLILTHFDSDHAGGAVDVLKDLKVENLYITDVYEDTNISNSIFEFIAEHDFKSSKVENIETVYNQSGFKLDIIKPSGAALASENQKSLIVNVNYKGRNVLFMGDGDVESFKSLPIEYKTHISVMKSGHHGAQYTVDKQMAENTDLFILSTGKNPYNHPHPDILNIIKKNGSNYIRTDRNNAIKVLLSDSDPKIYMYSPKFRKFVK